MPNYETKFSWRARLRSFSYAGSGLRQLFRTEHNSWIHFTLSVGAIAAAFIVGITLQEWMALIIVMGMVWAAEIFNTCIEKTADFITEERHPQIKIIKDLAAAAVLITAGIAVTVGALIFIPKII